MSTSSPTLASDTASPRRGRVVGKENRSPRSAGPLVDASLSPRRAATSKASLIGTLTRKFTWGTSSSKARQHEQQQQQHVQQRHLATEGSSSLQTPATDAEPAAPSLMYPSMVSRKTSDASDISSGASSAGSLAVLADQAEDDEDPFVPHLPRDDVVLELYRTERTFIRQLSAVLKVFYHPLLKDKSLLKPEDVKNIFGGIEPLLGVNQQLFALLDERLRDWSADQCIGDVLLQVAPFLKIYTSYCKSYSATVATLQDRMASNRGFHAFVESSLARNSAACGHHHSVTSLLILPVQRVPRYLLLVTDLLKKTPTSHRDHPQLQQVQAKLKEINKTLDHGVREYDSAARFMSWHKSLEGFEALVAPHRHQVRDAVFRVTPLPCGAGSSDDRRQHGHNNGSNAGGSSASVSSGGHGSGSGDQQQLQQQQQGSEFLATILLFNDLLVECVDTGKRTRSRATQRVSRVLPLELLWAQVSDQQDNTLEIRAPEYAARLCLHSTRGVASSPSNSVRAWLCDIERNVRQLLGHSPEDASVSVEQRAGLSYAFRAHRHLSSFVGSWRNGAMHEGRLTYRTGAVYEGTLHAGLADGSGTLTYNTDADVYTGDFKAGRFHGQGTMCYRNGDQYAGVWCNGVWHGHGELVLACGDRYTGEFVKGRFHGAGRWVGARGDVYDGAWLDGRRHGAGVFQCHGYSYEGNWVNNRRSGRGVLRYAGGAVYTGAFKDDMRHDDHGVLEHAAIGMRYVGAWAKDMRQGHGTMTEPDGSVYTGEWQRNERHGTGELRAADGAVFHGRWEHGALMQGTVRYADGTEYEGPLMCGLPHGHGTMTYTNGSVFVGMFQHGRRNGAGTLTRADFSVHEGSWVDDQPHGRGTITTLDGCVINAGFLHGRREGRGSYSRTSLAALVAGPGGRVSDASRDSISSSSSPATTAAAHALLTTPPRTRPSSVRSAGSNASVADATPVVWKNDQLASDPSFMLPPQLPSVQMFSPFCNVWSLG